MVAKKDSPAKAKARATANKIKGKVKAKPKAKPKKEADTKSTSGQSIKNDSTSPQVKSQALEAVKPAEIKNDQLILTDKHKALIQKQIAPNATKEELELFFMMAYRTRLDPLMKQLYFIKYGKGERASVSYVTSIDGYRIIAHRTGLFDGIDEPIYKSVGNRLHSCTLRVYKKGCKHAFAATVKFTEYNTGKNLWAKMPETMLAKVAEAHALRKAFPQDLSGIYTTDEMEQAKPAQVVSGKPAPAKPSPPSMITKSQAQMIVQIMEQKNIGKAKLKYFVQRSFGIEKDSLAKLTFKEAGTLIQAMHKIEIQEPEPQEDKEEVMAALDEVFGGNPKQTSFVEGEEVDIDEVAEGIDNMKAEEGGDSK